MGKSGVLEHKSDNISEMRKDIEEKLLWRAWRNSPALFRTVPPRPPAASSSSRLGVRNPNKTPIAISWGTGYSDFKFGR